MLAAAAGPLASVEDVLVVPPVRLHTLAGFDTAVFAFTTDVPFLEAGARRCCWARARSPSRTRMNEFVDIAELSRAVDVLSRLTAVYDPR